MQSYEDQVWRTIKTFNVVFLLVPQEVPVLKKERFNNWYCLKTYFIVYLVVDVPMQILYCTVYASVSYVMSAQPLDGARFLMFLGTCVLITLTAQSVGVLLGTTVNPIVSYQSPSYAHWDPLIINHRSTVHRMEHSSAPSWPPLC